MALRTGHSGKEISLHFSKAMSKPKALPRAS